MLPAVQHLIVGINESAWTNSDAETAGITRTTIGNGRYLILAVTGTPHIV